MPQIRSSIRYRFNHCLGRTVYYEVFSKDDLDKILDLEADRLQSLRYEPEPQILSRFRYIPRGVVSGCWFWFVQCGAHDPSQHGTEY